MSPRLLMLSCSLTAVFWSTAAFSQESAQQEEVDDQPIIIVTAQKREQNLIQVPIALTVQDAEELRRERAFNAYDILRQVPGISGSNPNGELTQVTIRGIASQDYGIGSDPTVGVFFDGVYLGRNESTGVNFIDLERAEVARGPQGALFGRATPGGAISLVPVRPHDQTEFLANAELGSQGLVQTSLIANTPLAENAFLRGSVIFSSDGDFVENLTTRESLGGEESITGRLALRYEAGLNTTVDVTGWYEDYKGVPWLYRNFTETAEDPDDLADLSSRFDFTDEIFSEVSEEGLISNLEAWGAILSVEHSFDNGMTFVSTSSAIGYDSDYLEDFDGTDLALLNYGQFDSQSLLTQEIRLVSSDTAAIRWFAGALIYREDIASDIVQSYGDFDLCVFYEFDDEDGCAPAGAGVTDTLIFADGDYQGFALYSEAEVDLTDRLAFTGGLRFTRDNKQLVINAPTPGGFLPAEDLGYTIPTDGLDVAREQTFTSWQPRFALTYRPSRDVALYAVYSEGEKPGGFDTFDPFSPAFEAEQVQSYEVGTKGSVLGGRLNYSMAAYLADYSELQVLVADGPRDIVTNAASAQSKGVEAELTYSFAGIELGLRGNIIDAEFEDFSDPVNEVDFSGNRLPYTPEWSLGATIGFEERFGDDWSVFGRANADIQGTQFLTPGNDQFASNPSYERVDFVLGLSKGDNVEVYAFGQNVTGSDFVGIGDVTDYSENFGAYLGQFPRPAAFGLGITFNGS